MTSKGKVKYASIEILSNDIDGKKPAKKGSSTKSSGENRVSRRSQSLDRVADENSGDSRAERTSRRHFMHLISEKNDQIEKLIKRVTTLHALNNEFAIEHEKLQNELEAVQQRCDQYDRERDKGCESCREYAKQTEEEQIEIDRLTHENAHLISDINMMKMLIYRLNLQLERCQEMCRKHDADSKTVPTSDRINRLPDGLCSGARSLNDLNSENIEQIEWRSVHSNALAPLLTAYDETIKDKNNLLTQYESELSRVTGRIKDILNENEQLYTEIDRLKRQNATENSDRTRLQAQVDVCRNKAEIHSKRADLAKEKLNEITRGYEQKIQSQSIDMQRIQEAYTRLKGELATCKTMHQQPELVIESLKECQRLYDELRAQHNQKVAKFTEDIDALKNVQLQKERDNQEQSQQLMEQKSTIEIQCDKIKSLDQKMEKMRRKFYRLRQSRDILKDRLRHTVSWNQKIEAAAKTINKVSWQDVHKIDQLLVQKEMQLQQIRAQHFNEVQKLQRKLTRRDEMLRKILLNKVKSLKKK